MFERGHERDRNVATNVAETWPTKWLIGHVVTWPACSAMLWPCSGHVEHDRNVATNVARTWPLRRTWPETWPETWPMLRQQTWPVHEEPGHKRGQPLGHVCGHVHYYFIFFVFSRFFFVFECRYRSQTPLTQIHLFKINRSTAKTIFSPNFSKRELAKSDLVNPIISSNWLTT